MICVKLASVGRGQILLNLRASKNVRLIHGWRQAWPKHMAGRVMSEPSSRCIAKVPPGIPNCQMYRFGHQIARAISTSSSLRSNEGHGLEQGSLIYQGPATSLVKGVKFFSLSTSVLTLGILPLIFSQAGNNTLNYIGGLFAVVIFVTPVLLHTISRTYVTKLYYNSHRDTYSAFTLTLFLRDRLTEFAPSDIEVPGVANLFTTFKVRGKALLVDPAAFPNPNDYNHLMGYDKFEQFNPEDIVKKLEKEKESQQKE